MTRKHLKWTNDGLKKKRKKREKFQYAIFTWADSPSSDPQPYHETFFKTV